MHMLHHHHISRNGHFTLSSTATRSVNGHQLIHFRFLVCECIFLDIAPCNILSVSHHASFRKQLYTFKNKIILW